MGDPQFVKRFAGMKRPGAYLRVLREGPLGAGDHVTLVPAPQTAPTLREAFELSSDRAPSREQLQSLLAAPLSIRTRKDVEARLARLA